MNAYARLADKGMTREQLLAEAIDAAAAAKNADLHARIHRNAARHHRDAAERNPLAKTKHETAAKRSDATAQSHTAAANRHRQRAADATRAAQTAISDRSTTYA